jgi:CheY-like chemotaxis protein
MTGWSRTLGLFVALATLSSTSLVASARADGVSDTFKEGVDLLQRGRKADALKAFQKVLAMSPTQEQAYGLWKDNDYPVWRDMLVEGGDFQLIAKRLMQLSLVERNARKSDKDAILALVKTATDPNGDPLERLKAVRTLSSDHGEYAVPYMVGLLNGQANEDKRIHAMLALAQMNSDVVMPLGATLHADDAVLRRNVAMVLGNIGDSRAVPALQWLAANDRDESVKQAAAESLAHMHASGDAYSGFLKQGDDYFYRRDSVLRDTDWSDVLWQWKGGQLVSIPCPRALYPTELSKVAYFHALHTNVQSKEALAGLARAYCDEQVKIDQMAAAGKDMGEWKARGEEALAALHAAGLDALDTALDWSAAAGDASTAGALCRVLGPIAKGATHGLNAALASSDGAIRAEAAVALGTISARNNATCDAQLMGQLGASATREIVHMAMIIDANAERASALSAALEKRGLFVSRWDSGARGLWMAHRAAGLDVLFLAESLPDITAAQILDELKADDRLAKVPVVVLAAKAEEATATYGDKIAGALADVNDLKPVEAALTAEMSGDRALAEDLARRAAETLTQMCHGGHCDCSSIVASLAGALEHRPDAVVTPILRVLELCGDQTAVANVVGVLADEARSEGVRAAAGHTLAGIVGRNSTALSAEMLAKVQGVTSSKAPLSVRDAASGALALCELDAAQRAELLHKIGMGASH